MSNEFGGGTFKKHSQVPIASNTETIPNSYSMGVQCGENVLLTFPTPF